jgi:hypothetical protein
LSPRDEEDASRLLNLRASALSQLTGMRNPSIFMCEEIDRDREFAKKIAQIQKRGPHGLPTNNNKPHKVDPEAEDVKESENPKGDSALLQALAVSTKPAIDLVPN